MFAAIVEASAFMAAGLKLAAILRMKMWHPPNDDEQH